MPVIIVLYFMVIIYLICCCIFLFKQKTAYEMRISDWSSDVCSSDLSRRARALISIARNGSTACFIRSCFLVRSASQGEFDAGRPRRDDFDLRGDRKSVV